MLNDDDDEEEEEDEGKEEEKVKEEPLSHHLTFDHHSVSVLLFCNCQPVNKHLFCL